MTKESNNAGQKPSSLKPSTISPAIIKIAALMTNKNSPNVKSVAGIVRRIRMGLTNLFKRVITMELIITVSEESTEKPSSK
jgi:hypothetical protein